MDAALVFSLMTICLVIGTIGLYRYSEKWKRSLALQGVDAKIRAIAQLREIKTEIGHMRSDGLEPPAVIYMALMELEHPEELPLHVLLDRMHHLRAAYNQYVDEVNQKEHNV